MKTLNQIHQELISKKKTVRQIVDEAISVIKNNEKKFNAGLYDNEDINAILGFYSDEFLEKQILNAQNLIDQKIKENRIDEINIFTGVPIILKDNIMVAGEKNTSGSKMLENYISTYDASVVKKLKESGAILLARGNMDEFAMGGSGENSAFNITKNPIDTSLVPGGSSSGSAASVCYGAVAVSLGSDTGGSIRLPAAFCNLVGFKPTYGSVSRFGLMAMGSSLDQIGPFANNVSDCEALFDLINFYDENDSTSTPSLLRTASPEEAITSNRQQQDSLLGKAPKAEGVGLKKRIGIPKILNDEKMKSVIAKEILENFDFQILKFKNLGYQIVEIDLPNLDKALAVYYVITPAEVSSNMGRYDGVRYGHFSAGKNTVENFIKSRTEGFGDEVRRRILIGTYILSAGYFDAYYNKALAVREILKKEFENIFNDKENGVDAILTPVSPVMPWKFGERADPLAMYLADIFTVTANIVGVPAISFPTKNREDLNGENLPIGIQLFGNYFEDKKLFKIAKEFRGE
jgi:aspartyl-tRNA(Asn)/glutamyl-tRNA(Gln) amidotransferase subunit A